MEYLKEYNIEKIDYDGLEEFTNLQVKCFNEQNYYDEHFTNTKRNFYNGYIFLGAKLFSDNSIIGGICLEKTPIYKNEIYIESLFVDSKFNNSRIATNLIDYIINKKQELFNMRDVNLYLYCFGYLKNFYEHRSFIVTDSFNVNDNKIKTFRMDRKI